MTRVAINFVSSDGDFLPCHLTNRKLIIKLLFFCRFFVVLICHLKARIHTQTIIRSSVDLFSQAEFLFE